MKNDTNPWVNVDFPDVIACREKYIPRGEREKNVVCDITDHRWFDEVPFEKEKGVIFLAAGVLYYFTTDQVRALLCAMAERFPGGVVAFDAVNRIGLKAMAKTVLSQTGMSDIDAYFSVGDAPRELSAWSDAFASVTARSYMSGYRRLGIRYGLLPAVLNWFADHLVRMSIVRVAFR